MSMRTNLKKHKTERKKGSCKNTYITIYISNILAIGFVVLFGALIDK